MAIRAFIFINVVSLLIILICLSGKDNRQYINLPSDPKKCLNAFSGTKCIKVDVI